jgi:two-component system chemotaxis sensor kinase CheA
MVLCDPRSCTDATLVTELLATFLTESHEHLDTLDLYLVQLENGRAEDDVVHALFRAAHTLKGAAAMLGLASIVQVTHALEGVLVQLRDGDLLRTANVTSALLDGTHVLRSLLDATERHEPDSLSPAAEHALETLRQLLSQRGAESARDVLRPADRRDLRLELRFQCSEAELSDKASSLLSDLRLLGELRELEQSVGGDPHRYKLVLRGDARHADIEGLVAFADAEVRIQELQPPSAPAPRAGSRSARSVTQVRVDSARFDALVDRSGELVVASARVEQLVRELNASDARMLDAMKELNLAVRDVQERAIALRMVPVRETFLRFERPVRDLARELGKQVELTAEGLETELDRKLLDALADPLKHLVRNAVAHGIELPAQRLAAGKPATGSLRLRASQHNGVAHIEVADDGAGIDRERVVRKAISRGLLSESAELSEQEAFALLFLPGFSTAERVDEISGRGVGLDVVQQAVEALRGMVEVRSQPRIGTTFQIQLPASLATLDGILVRCGGRAFLVPLEHVILTVSLDNAKPIRDPHGTWIVDVNGEPIALVGLESLLEGQARGASKIAVVVSAGRGRFALGVDQALGLIRAVTKPISAGLLHRRMANGRPVSLLSGATVLADGSVGLVLDVSGIQAAAASAVVRS